MLKAESREKIKKIWVGFFFLVFFLILWVNQTIRSTQTSYLIKKVEEEIKIEERKQEDLEMERNRILSLEAIENTAKEKLGMDHPKEKDIIIMPIPRKGGR